MNATYAETKSFIITPVLTYASDYYTPVGRAVPLPAPIVRRHPTIVIARTAPVSLDDVCALIEAAGPLTAVDIAGGLAISVSEAANSVRRMVDAGQLKQDEWGRYHLVVSETA